MKLNILQKMKALATLMLAFFAVTTFAQDINQAGEIFNQGNQAVKNGNYQVAIEKYEESIKVASALGAEGEQIVSGAKAQIPSLYYKIGAADYKSKNIDKAIEEFGKAIEYGKKYGDDETVKKSEDIIPKLYYAKGNALFKQKNYEEALTNFQHSGELNPNYCRAKWGAGLAYSRLKKFDEMDQSFSEALKLAEAKGDSKMISKIKSTAQRLLQAEAANKLQSQDWNTALKYLQASLKYNDADKDTYYYLALAYNGSNNYDKALEATQKGLDLSKNENNEYKAKYYYEMGNAYKGKSMNKEACEAFTNARYGRFTESADYELKTVLKCN